MTREEGQIEVRPAAEGLPGMHFPRCCAAPAPEMHNRVYCGNTCYTDIFCGSCYITLGRLIWNLRYNPEVQRT